ncbi:uncharacterized protein [Equus przewalskii]|uniref:Uncharacterized protein n=1 Tax=Equus przewalskii TaxID=9798 RepID=A0ABM4QEH8_EQUPR
MSGEAGDDASRTRRKRGLSGDELRLREGGEQGFEEPEAGAAEFLLRRRWCRRRRCRPRRRWHLASPESGRRPGSAGARQRCKGARRCTVPPLSAARVSAARAFRSGTSGSRVAKGPPSSWLARSSNLAPPPVPLSRSHPPGPTGAAGPGTGRGSRRGGTWKNHPDCIAVGEAARRAGSPEPPPCGAFSVRCSQVLYPTWARECRLAGTRDPLRGPAERPRARAAAARRPKARRATVAANG